MVPIKQELNGQSLPTAANSKLTISKGTYVFETYAIDKGESTHRNGKMDVYSKEGLNAGKHYTAIYKLENGLLTICYNLTGGDYPTKFDSAGDPMLFLCEFKKQ